MRVKNSQVIDLFNNIIMEAAGVEPADTRASIGLAIWLTLR